MRGTIPPLPNTPSWRDAQLKDSTQGQLYHHHHHHHHRHLFEKNDYLRTDFVYVKIVDCNLKASHRRHICNC
jgi:hypothetical protein